ncbi:MAG: flavodoxin [Prevotella sp.]|nr:flavodoxin [Prevotella sp.]MDY4038539.1 flavodoxin [Prevotella sp.]
MRRTIHLSFIFALITLTACTQHKPKSNDQGPKTLIAYFSVTGRTAEAAEQLADAIDGKLYEIKPEVKYKDEDLNWHDDHSRSSMEMKDRNARPAIIHDLELPEDYDRIFIGFPIWSYTAPTIINTFLESYPFEGKLIALFATSGGNTPDKALQELRQKYPKLRFVAAKLLNDEDQTEMKKWADSIK